MRAHFDLIVVNLHLQARYSASRERKTRTVRREQRFIGGLEIAAACFARIDLSAGWWPISLVQSDIERVLFDAPAIHKRLDEMAAQITADYPDRELTVIAILTGSLMFMSDLLRRIPLPLKLDCISVASYHGQSQTSGKVSFKDVIVPDVADRDILILDDILDTGHTLAAVRKRVEAAQPRSIRICVLLCKRKLRARDVDADYIGFEMDDEFVVGYGLDYMQRYRNLPYIGVLKKQRLESTS
jgi:hypoxanthine phosphoribosyltransferase